MKDVGILLLEDSAADQELVTRELRGLGWSSVRCVSTRENFLEALSSFQPSLVLADYRLGAFDAREALELVQGNDPELPFILLTGTLDEETAVKFLRAGASDYVLKDRLARLGPAINHALLVRELRNEKERNEAALKEHEERLQQSEKRYRSLFEHNPIAMWVFDLETSEILSVNSTAIEKLGYSEDELLAMRVTDVDPNAASESPKPVEISIRRNDGSVLEFERIWIPTTFGGRRSRLVAALDVTERKRAERDLADREKLLRRIFDAEPECVKLLDKDGNILEMNPAGLEMIEVDSIDEVRNQPIYPFIGPQYRSRFRDALGGVFRGESANLEYEILGRRGTRRWMDMRAVALRDAAGEVTTLLAITRDVSKAKELEELFRQSQKMEAIGRLAGGVAHDFNNILTIIGGYASLTLDLPNISEAVRKHVTTINNGVLRAAALTRQLLTFSRRQLLQPRVLDINSLIKTLSSLITSMIGEDVHLALRLGKTIGNIRADPSQIEQVIMNLVVNARDAMPHGGKVSIETCDVEFDGPVEMGSFQIGPGHFVNLTVTDTGFGMSKEVLTHIFEPFFTTKEPGKGTGLGLSTVYGIVQQSGGAVMVHSAPNAGSRFEVYFPVVREPVTASPVSQPVTPLGTLSCKETVMVVEDDSPLRELIHGMLGRFGYNVVTAESAITALQMLEQGTRVDLILTDVVMPGMSGLVLGHQVQQRKLPIKVVYMSGYNEDFITGSPVGADGALFIEKPFTQETLGRTIRLALDA